MSNFNGTTLNAGSGGPILATSLFVNGSPAQSELMPWTALAYLASGNANDTTGVFQTVGPANGMPVSAAQSGVWSMALLAGSALVGQFEISDGTNVLGTSSHPLVVSVNSSISIAGTSAISIADGANVTFGVEADAAAISDTATASFMSLFKRGLQHLASIIGQLPAALTGAGNLKVAIEESVATISVSGTVGVSGTVAVDSELTTADLDTGAGVDTRAVVGLVVAASGGGVLVSSANPLPVSGSFNSAPSTGTLTDRSGTITTGGTAQTLAATNDSRKYLLIENLDSAESLWINFTTTAVVGRPSIEIQAGGSLVMDSAFVSTEAVSVIAATTGHAFTAKEG